MNSDPNTGRSAALDSEVWSPRSLMELTRGNYAIHKGVWRSSASIELLRFSGPGRHGPAGAFFQECRGMLNSSETATLQLDGHEIAFSRNAYIGRWTIDGRHAAETQMGRGRRWFYWGRSDTRMMDGTRFVVKMPLLGLSSLQRRDCFCTAIMSDDSRVRLFLARPRQQPQFFFDRTEMDLLERLPRDVMAVLLGELLRIRSIYIDG